MDLLDALKLIYGDVHFLPITDEVINKFVNLGCPLDDINFIISQGGFYCPERNSFVLPPEWDFTKYPDYTLPNSND